jgi:hypothetical protein
VKLSGHLYATTCLSACVRRGIAPGESLSLALLQVVVVTAPLGCCSSRWGQHYGALCPETWDFKART